MLGCLCDKHFYFHNIYLFMVDHASFNNLFIPLLFALFERIIFRFSVKDIVFFILLFFISTVGFGNPAFLAALLFLQFLLLIIFL